VEFFHTLMVSHEPSLKKVSFIKAVLVKLNQEIKELDQLQVYNDLLIKELFIHEYKLFNV